MVYLKTNSVTNIYESSRLRSVSNRNTNLNFSNEINCTINYKKLFHQKQYQSNWTLKYPTDSTIENDPIMIDSSINDGSLLLLSPYSKSCYLLSQKKSSKKLPILCSDRNSYSKPSKSMLNLCDDESYRKSLRVCNSSLQKQSNDSSVRLSTSLSSSSSFCVADDRLKTETYQCNEIDRFDARFRSSQFRPNSDRQILMVNFFFDR